MTATSTAGLQLCKYSRSEHLASKILEKCPLALSEAEHDYCPCRKREEIVHGRMELRVLTCTFPKTYKEETIAYPYSFGQAVGRQARQIMQAERMKKEPLFNMAATTKQQTEPEKPPPLFPQPMPIIGVTGDYGSGKTVFALTICPGPGTRVYDAEKSTESYQSLGFDLVDIPAEMLKLSKGKGYKPIQTWEWFRDHVRAIKPGQFRVIALDPVSEIETGLCDWVRANPGHFGRTPAQYQKMSGLFWGDVKELWKMFLADLASRCEVFVFTSHLKNLWAGDRPTGKRVPKGKDTLMELASLYLQMERRADSKGNKPEKPSAIVLKSRLMSTAVDANGELILKDSLPPRIPICTPAAIRQYMLNPPDYSKLREDELAPEEVMSEDDKAQLRLATAEAEAETVRLRLEEMERKEKAAARAEAKAAKSVTLPPGKPIDETRIESRANPAKPVTETPAASNGDDGNSITHEQIERIRKLKDALFSLTAPGATEEERREMWHKIMAKRGVTSATELDSEQAAELIHALRSKIETLEMQAELEKGESPAGAKRG